MALAPNVVAANAADGEDDDDDNDDDNVAVRPLAADAFAAAVFVCDFRRAVPAGLREASSAQTKNTMAMGNQINNEIRSTRRGKESKGSKR